VNKGDPSSSVPHWLIACHRGEETFAKKCDEEAFGLEKGRVSVGYRDAR